MTNERNHWITFPDHRVAGWEATLPGPRGDAERLVQLGIALVDAGKRHGVWNAQRFATTADFEAYVRTAVGERGTVPLLFGESTPGHVACYRDGRIVELEVADVGVLLRELRPDRPTSVTRSAPPVVVRGASLRVDHAEDVVIEIRLDTDLWFPRVMGMCEPIPDDEDAPESYDNRELAARHTPRLNRFLAEVRKRTIELGGRWTMLDADGIARNYTDQWDASGILAF